MSGKWHVGGEYDARFIDTWQPGAPNRPTPRQRGFDRFFGIIDGCTHYFCPHYLMEDDERVTSFDDDFYMTDAIADKAIEMIEDGQDDDRPFFLYLAHVAPHWPLHAREEDIARYEGAYLKGWDAIRTARHEEMLSRGILQHKWEISARDPEAPPWSAVEISDWEARRMAVYAAMVDRMDQSIGRVLEVLKRLGEYDNTLILFLSDNGGCAELMAEDGWAKFFPDVTHDGRKMTMGNRPDVEPGGPLTYMSYDLPWANVSNTPYRKFKHWVHEGGISTPLIAHWPKRLQTPNVRHAPCHVVDLLPTILDAAGAPYPSELGGHEIQPVDGESFLPAAGRAAVGAQSSLSSLSTRATALSGWAALSWCASLAGPGSFTTWNRTARSFTISWARTSRWPSGSCASTRAGPSRPGWLTGASCCPDCRPSGRWTISMASREVRR